MSRPNNRKRDYTALLGQQVKWTSQGSGIPREKRGQVVAVRKDKHSPWQWLSEDHRRFNDETPAGEHSRGKLERYSTDIARVIVLRDATAQQKVRRYATPHGSLLEKIEAA